MTTPKKALVVYSSRIATGNTRKIAEAIHRVLGENCEIATASEAPNPDNYDFIMLGFGVYRGWPDGDIRAYMRKCRNRPVGIFLTLGAWPDSVHAHNCMGRAEGLLDSCRVVARFIGHGRLDPAMVTRMKQRPAGTPHSWDDERAQRVAEAEKHPDAADLTQAAETFGAAWEKIRTGNTVHPTGEEKKALLLVAFGSTVPSAMAAYDRIEQAAVAAHPGLPVFRAYTSGVVRRKLAAAGTPCQSVAGTLNELSLAGYTAVKILALNIVPGEEYHKLGNEIAAFRNATLGFKELELSRPLLSDAARLHEVAEALAAIVPSERCPAEAVVFMGHGNRGGNCDCHYLALASLLKRRDPYLFLTTVEGGTDFAAVRADLKFEGIGKAYLMPFMTVAGDHAINDLAGTQAESWKSQLEADGIDCIPVLKGLGEYDRFAELFARGEI